MQLLTTEETAAYLRLKERKLYELVANQAIPCTKITGRWLFPKAELDRWLAGGIARLDASAPAEPMPIVGGSHDPLLEWALRESGCGLATLSEGSEAGLTRFIAGEVVAAAIHLHAVANDNDANIETLQNSARLRDAVLINFVRREQGLLLARGNPLGIESLEQAVQRSARFALRPKGAGAQLLLELLLFRAGLRSSDLAVVNPPCPTGPDIAQAIRAGRTDCGIATRSVANAAALDFVSLTWEWFDLAVHHRDYFRAPLQSLWRFLQTSSFHARARELGGYDTERAASVRFAP
jgi:putative molybdopterin biosynthesis protein